MKYQLNRRDFIKLVGGAGGGLVLAVYLEGCAPDVPDTATVQVPPTAFTSTPAPREPAEWTPNIYLKLDHNGILTVTAFRSEMGQGIRTAIAMLLAEELDVDWKDVRIEQALTDSKYGDQSTGGSVSIASYYSVLRSAGAVARQMLLEAASQVWDVDPNQCESEAGFVIHPDGTQKLAYGDLVDIASRLDVPGQASPKDESQFKMVGTAVGHWDAPQIVSGKAVFGLDVRLPGMLFAVIARCPVFDGTFESYEDAAARAIPGVKDVIDLGDRIAVLAENSWAAIQGRHALKVTWKEGRNATLDSEQMIASALGTWEKSTDSNILDAYYVIPYEAHATMEPMNCTAYLHDDICEVWAPTQSPQEVQGAAARVTGLQRSQVLVHVPLIGGGFGRRLQSDYAAEAARLAQAVQAPVQVLWTRDDDLQHDFYHPMAVQYASAALDKIAMPNIRLMGGMSVPTGPWRSVDQFTRAYAEQSFLDEMAVAMQRDPLELRRELYKNNERALAVINLAAEKSGWGQPLPPGQGRGLAYFATFGVTHVAQVAEVTVDATGNVRVDRVVCAVDCRKAINPDNVAAQMEGGIAFGLTAALKAQAVIKNGRAQLSNFHDYPILRMDEMPTVEVYVLESAGLPTGIGEMGVPPIVPAVANAVFAATGKRIRHIPIRPADLA
jgi:isoquinoline 1-oxidoreductase beta subunit